MSAKAIYETDGKSLLAKCFQNTCYVKNKFAVVVHDTNWDAIVQENPWIASEVSYFFVYILIVFKFHLVDKNFLFIEVWVV